MNPYFPRFIPSVFAALALIGCFMPLIGMGNDAPSLFAIPDLFSQSASLMGGLFGSRANDATTGLEIAAFLAKFFYLVPLLAVIIIYKNLRGFVGQWPQLFASIVWLIAPLVFPWGVDLAMNANEETRGFAAFVNIKIGSGGWLILLCGAGMFMNTFGLIKINLATIGNLGTPGSEGQNSVNLGQSVAPLVNEVSELSNRVAQKLSEKAPEMKEKTAQALHAAGDAASHISKVAAEHAPVIQEKAGKILKTAGAAAVQTGDLLADPRNRRGLFTVVGIVLALVLFFYVLLPTVRYFSVWMEKQASREQIHVSALDQMKEEAIKEVKEEEQKVEKKSVFSSLTPSFNENAALFEEQEEKSSAKPKDIIGRVSGYSSDGWPIINDTEIRLAGIGMFNPSQREKMQSWIQKQGNVLSCKPLFGAYLCLTQSRIDVAQAALLNGAARVSGQSPTEYQEAEAKAKEAGRGLWK